MADLAAAYRRLTHREFLDEAAERFGREPAAWAFACPRCGDVATMADFPSGEQGRIGQECVGRWRGAGIATGPGARGCDWTAYGLFRGPWEVVMADGHSAFSFPFAPAAAAQPVDDGAASAGAA